MTLREMRDMIKSEGSRISANDTDLMIDAKINQAYKGMSMRAHFPHLRVDFEQFDTVSRQDAYYLAYPIWKIAKDSVRYDVTDTSQGVIVPLRESQTQLYRTFSGATVPGMCAITGPTGTSYYSTGTVAVTNGGTAVTGTGTTFTSAMVGMWIRFGSQAGIIAGDYGYQISAFVSGALLTLATQYRGPTLTLATYQIRPGNTKRLLFDPPFDDGGGKMIEYSWYRFPERLYNDDDVPEIPELDMAIVYKVLTDSTQLQKASYTARDFSQQARQYWNQVAGAYGV